MSHGNLHLAAVIGMKQKLQEVNSSVGEPMNRYNMLSTSEDSSSYEAESETDDDEDDCTGEEDPVSL